MVVRGPWVPRRAGGVVSCHGGVAWVQGTNVLSESLFSGAVQLWWSSLFLSALHLPQSRPWPSVPSPVTHLPQRERGCGCSPCSGSVEIFPALALLEMKDWRQPAWTSRAGVTAFLARPRAWPALPKPGERPEFHDTECLPSPQGFTKSRLCCRVTCDGQDAGELVLLGCSSGERKVRGSALDAKATGGMRVVDSCRNHGHQPCCCSPRPRPWNKAQHFPAAMISITL